jgi:hypothetical protein
MLRKIEKSPEPECLTRYRKGSDLNSRDVFANIPGDCKRELQRQLRSEQFGLCGFCGRRMNLAYSGGRFLADSQGGLVPRNAPIGEKGWPASIEHLLSQKDFPANRLDHTNLVGCCDSYFSGAQTCNGRKADQALAILNPVTGQGLSSITMTRQGVLDSTNSSVAQDLKKVLNLNCEPLCRARKNVVDRLSQDLGTAQKQGRFPEALKRAWTRNTVPVDGLLPEFAEVARRYLEPKMKKNGYSI